MNWSLIGILSLALLMLLLLLGVIILYIRHWANRHTSKAATFPPHEGHYFVRYLSPRVDVTAERQTASSTPSIPRKYWQYLLSIASAILLLGSVALAAYHNWHKLTPPIDLTEEELANLSLKEQGWQLEDTQSLPVLETYLSSLRNQKQGIILIQDRKMTPWQHNGRTISRQARTQWNSFADVHNLPIIDCYWEDLLNCRAQKQDWLHIVIPSRWQVPLLKTLLDEGSKVILYGAPQQVFPPENTAFTFEGLTLNTTPVSLQNDVTGLALVADRELTLGFDAGLILTLPPLFSGYEAKTETPQAISITEDAVAGGSNATRLYAKTTPHNGRLIWMDFAPNPEDHSDELNHNHHQALIAALLRYLEGQPYHGWANWPQGLPYAALMEEDTEDQYHYAEAVADFFQQNRYPITWYIIANEAQQNRQLTQKLAETGEIACHGDSHQSFATNDIHTQNIRLARCKKILETLTGKPVRSFRPPEEKHNAATLDVIGSNGMTHFIAKHSGDRFTPSIYLNADKSASLVSIPRMNNDDYAMWNTFKLTENDSIRLVNHESDWVKSVGGLYMFSFHTQFMGQDGHLNVIKHLAERIKQSNAYFATASDIAEWWQVRRRLLNQHSLSEAEWEKFQPVYLSVDSQGKLHRQVITSPHQLSHLTAKESSP